MTATLTDTARAGVADAAPIPRRPARLPARELARVLGNAAPFAGNDDTLPILNAVRLRARGQTLTADATDRHALLRETCPLDRPADPFDVLVPLPAARQIRQMLAAARRQDAAAVAELAVTGRRLRAAAGAMAVEADAAAGDFPDLDMLIAREDAHAAEHGPGRFDTQLAPRLLARLGKLRTAEAGRCPPARLSQPAPGMPRMRPVQVALGDRLRVLIMPVRPKDAP